MKKNAHHIQFGALCYRRKPKKGYEVLLITTRRTKRWSVPKGWPIAGKTPGRVAAIEAFEEAGVTGRITGGCLGFYSYHKHIKDDETLLCMVGLYPIEVSHLSDDFPETGQRKRKWLSPVEAAKKVSDPELKTFLLRFEEIAGLEEPSFSKPSEGESDIKAKPIP